MVLADDLERNVSALVSATRYAVHPQLDQLRRARMQVIEHFAAAAAAAAGPQDAASPPVPEWRRDRPGQWAAARMPLLSRAARFWSWVVSSPFVVVTSSRPGRLAD
jgi:hypothetical protein